MTANMSNLSQSIGTTKREREFQRVDRSSGKQTTTKETNM